MPTINLPFPNSPGNGDDFDADPVRANLQFLIQVLQSFPGDNIQAKSILENALSDAINPRLRAAESFTNYVVSGGLPGGFSGLTLTVPTGTAYTSGYRHTITAQSFTVAINKDTYFSVNKSSAVDTPQAVVNGGAVPTVPTDSQWLFFVRSNGTAITQIVDLRSVRPVNNICRFNYYRSAAQTPGANAVAFDTKVNETGSNFNTTTGAFTAPFTGTYGFSANLSLTANAANRAVGCSIVRTSNGVDTTLDMSTHVVMYTGTFDDTTSISIDNVDLLQGDLVKVYDAANSGFSLVTGRHKTNFSGHLISTGI